MVLLDNSVHKPIQALTVAGLHVILLEIQEHRPLIPLLLLLVPLDRFILGGEVQGAARIEGIIFSKFRRIPLLRSPISLLKSQFTLFKSGSLEECVIPKIEIGLNLATVFRSEEALLFHCLVLLKLCLVNYGGLLYFCFRKCSISLIQWPFSVDLKVSRQSIWLFLSRLTRAIIFG